MSSDLEKLKSPQIVISFLKDGAAVDLVNWEKGGISPTVIERAFHQVHQTLHQFRAKALLKMQQEDAKKKELEATRDPLTERG